MPESVDDTLVVEILKELRKEQRDQRTLLLQTSEAVRKLHQYTEENLLAIRRELLNIEERMKAHKDDLELMLKSELLGSLVHFQTKIENYVDQRLSEKAD
jgi:hypothetical protein